jgi:hypothetical protein
MEGQLVDELMRRHVWAFSLDLERRGVFKCESLA